MDVKRRRKVARKREGKKRSSASRLILSQQITGVPENVESIPEERKKKVLSEQGELQYRHLRKDL